MQEMRSWIGTGALLASVLLATSGCGGSSGGSTGPDGTAAWNDYCDVTGPQMQTACSGGWRMTDSSTCHTFGACLRPLVRTDLYGAVADCYAGLACGAPDDICLTAAGLGATESDAASSFHNACVDTQYQCQLMGTAFAPDYCVGTYLVMNDLTLAALGDCLKLPCADVEACFRSIFNCSY